ncbi:unnamed protein product [Soboliphyme baturini]|uniref:Uncharacterized protein n=1 Tax=Soboliphyme baturini TaxID=241478 RepID=A0A183IA97_9BILA|nr:unnamed protein product [Soboliphyme baturini]
MEGEGRGRRAVANIVEARDNETEVKRKVTLSYCLEVGAHDGIFLASSKAANQSI